MAFELRLTVLIPLNISNQKPLHFICGCFEHHEEGIFGVHGDNHSSVEKSVFISTSPPF